MRGLDSEPIIVYARVNNQKEGREEKKNMSEADRNNKKLKAQLEKEAKEDSKQAAKDFVRESAESAVDSVRSPMRAGVRQEAFDRARDIPILGSIVSAVHSASYIPGAEKSAKNLGKKILNSSKDEKKENGKMGENKKDSNKKTGIIIGVVVAAIVIIGGVILTLFLTGVIGGKHPKNIAELQDAIRDQKAINCEITHSEEEGKMTLQANEGWSKIRMFGEAEGLKTDIWFIEGDATYMSMMGMSLKTAYDRSQVDEFIDGMGDGSEEDDGKTNVSCSNPKDSDFAIPERDWADMSQFGDME